MSNVTKKDLIETISERTGLTQVDTRLVVENLLEEISKCLESCQNIEIRGFGRFKVKKRKPRTARNPRTGEIVNVKEGLKPVFEASKELKTKANEHWKNTQDNQDAPKDDSQNNNDDGSTEEPIY